MSGPVEVDIVDVTIDDGTMPARRPRCTCVGGRAMAYNDAGYRGELERLGWLLTAARKPRGPVSGDVIVELIFYRPTRAAVDVDNLTKTILDAGKNVLWRDDDQVVGLHVRKFRGVGKGKGRTVVKARCVATDRAFV